MPELDEDALRQAASHRGLKLVKSRKRKRGVGDFGRYGLQDAAGNWLFGFSAAGFSATPDMIADFLRSADASTWRQSALIAPGLPKSAGKLPAAKVDDLERISRIRKPARAPKSNPPARPAARPDRAKAYRETPTKTAPADADTPPPEPASKPEASLAVRPAMASDLPHVAALLGGRGNAQDPSYVAHLSAIMRKDRLLIAEKTSLLGCAAWHVIPTLQGPIGRMTLLFVTETARLKGYGRALLGAAIAAMAKEGCTVYEAMSDIEIINSNGFWRATGFRQASYRYVFVK